MSTSFVDLKPLCNAGLATALIPAQSGWAGFPIAAKKLDGLPVGPGVFAAVPFRVVDPKAKGGKCLLLMGPDDSETRTLPVDASFAAMYLLHTIDRGDLGRTPVVYSLHYADGTRSDHPITVGRDVADWLFPREFANCRIGWTGYHKDNEFHKCVYVAEIVNPQPTKRVASVSLKRCEPYGQYALLGVTLSTSPAIFASRRGGRHVGLADHIRLESDVLRLRDGALQIEAALCDRKGNPIRGARLTAEIAGKTYRFQADRDGYALSVPREKGWRKYANTVRITAARNGKRLARHEAVFYCEGHPRMLKPPHRRRPPQFIIIAFDDCKSLAGVEAMLEIIERLRAKGARAPFTMYTSPCPPRSADLEKIKLLYQRMYDLGCEFCNHTLNHNPGGVNWYALPRRGQVREIAGCRQWLRDNIHGLWHVYSQKSGGGGHAGFRDRKFSRDLLRSQRFEYNANNVTARYQTAIPHPDVQFWPYKLGQEWAIDIGMIDGNAPPVHKPITKGFFTDYSGKFDYPVRDGVEMMRANFEYRYNSRFRPPLIVNAFHEWGMTDYYGSHRNERAILEGFLTEVLVAGRRKHPEAHCITFHQLIEYMRTGDVEAVLAAGNGQGRET
ncbi:MAG TPA: polysaccharide deacetylase family protein [Phycisphaerae bacterium]|nr:polysaccharide deacetylase family protein [Phycisphaerae bacterium]